MKKKDDFYTWLDQIADKKAGEWKESSLKLELLCGIKRQESINYEKH